MDFLNDFFQQLNTTDTGLFLALNRCHSTYFDYFMSSYSGKWIWIPMYASLFYVLIRNFSWKVTLLCVVGLALTITFADQVSATLIRPYVERMRPSNPNNPLSELVHIVNGRRGGRYGFPSCHAANTFGLAFFIYFLLRRKWLTWFLMGWAILTCYSRIYLGVHYPGDLFVGMLVGLLGAALMYKLFRLIHKAARPEMMVDSYAPILTGSLTILTLLCYAGIMTWG